MNKEGVHIHAGRARKMNLKKQRKGRTEENGEVVGGGGEDKNIAEMSLICLLYSRGQSRDRNRDTR